MIKRIDDVCFAGFPSETKKFVTKFCASPWENPMKLIYIIGNTGIGKTNLLHAFGTELMLNNPQEKINITDKYDLAIQYVMYIKSKDDSLLSRYQKSDIILLDNFEYLNNKPRTSIVISNFIHSLLKENKKIIISGLDKN